MVTGDKVKILDDVNDSLDCYSESDRETSILASQLPGFDYVNDYYGSQYVIIGKTHAKCNERTGDPTFNSINLRSYDSTLFYRDVLDKLNSSPIYELIEAHGWKGEIGFWVHTEWR